MSTVHHYFFPATLLVASIVSIACDRAGACGDPNALCGGVSQCAECMLTDAVDESLSYTPEEINQAYSGRWRGEYLNNDEFGPVQFELQLDLAGAPKFAVVEKESESCVPEASIVSSCTGVRFAEGLTITSDSEIWTQAIHANWPGAIEHIGVRGRNLNCETPSLSDCFSIQAEFSLDKGGDEDDKVGVEVHFVITNDETLWVKFDAVSGGETEFIAIGGRIP